MRAYQKERFENAVCYFAKEHSKRTGRSAYQTYIYKYLALFDFLILEEEGQPALGIAYNAMKNGPVPNCYFWKNPTSRYRFVEVRENDKDHCIIEPLSDPDMDYFSIAEVEAMDKLLDEFARPGVTTWKIIDATHKRIAAWKKAWAKRGERTTVPMKYSDQFSDTTSSEVLERYSVYEVLNNGARRCVSLGSV